MIYILLNIIGMQVLKTKSLGFNPRMCWFMHPTLLKTMPINLYWNQYLMCFLCLSLNLNMKIILNWLVYTFILMVVKDMYTAIFQKQSENTSLQFLLNLLCSIMLVFYGYLNKNRKLILMLMIRLLIGLNMVLGTIQQS